MDTELKIIEQRETNAFADPSRSYDGGGYSQPEYSIIFNGKKGIFYDSSCGAFGSRFYVRLGAKEAEWGSMIDAPSSDFSSMNLEDVAFIGACGKAFEEWPPTEEELDAVEKLLRNGPPEDQMKIY